MDVYQTDYSKINLWNHTDLAYITRDKSLSRFYQYSPEKSLIPEVLKTRKGFNTNRKLLYNVLKKQYSDLGVTLPVEEAVMLNENTFTVTTGHQPTLFTGPLFHIYKIASTIHLAKELTTSLSGHTILPVFLIGSEDHDWVEVNHFNLFGKKYVWERSASGPCGRLSTTGLDHLIQTITDLFANSFHANEIKQIFNNSLQKAANYSQFHRLLLHGLFGKSGLILLDMDDAELKHAFVPIMEKEIREQFSIKYVSETQKELEKAGFKAQAYCRQVNLFYMTDELRERLDPYEGGIIRVDSKIKYSIEEIVKELHEHPERFSPNVILRPLYDEFILPNLVYIGGGGEIAYWLERKSQFEAVGVPFPMLLRRNSLMMIDGQTKSQLDKLDLTWEDLVGPYDTIVKKYLKNHTENELSYDAELEMMRQAYEMLAVKAKKIDPGLSTAILAEQSKQIKQFEQLGSRLLRTEKQTQETNLKRIQRLKEKLFPEGGLQERHENFLTFFSNYGPKWIEELITICDPWVGQFLVLEMKDPQPS